MIDTPPIKVIHLSGGDKQSGAGRGAQWLHEGLLLEGIDSSIRFRSADLQRKLRGGVIDRISAGSGRVALSLNWRASVLTAQKGPHPYALAPFRLMTRDDRTAIAQSDVAHVHWVSDGSYDIPAIAATGIPTVVTLRDMWPFTGGCGYDLGCGRYRGDCSPCPALKPWAKSLARWRQRMAAVKELKNVRFVAISDWLRDTALASSLLCDANVIAIPNAIDHCKFFPAESTEMRRKLGIGDEEQVVVAGCLYLDAGYKNMQAIVDIWHKIAKAGRRLVIFGQRDHELRNALGDKAVFVGKIGNDAEMRALYSLADVFVSPSLQEAFGKTAAEAGICGTPVVTFADSGTADVVQQGRTGWAVPLGNNAALAEAVDAILLAGGRKSSLGAAARSYCLSNFASTVIAARYKRLYEDMIS